MQKPIISLLVVALLTLAACGEATDTDDAPENSKPLKVQHALGVARVPGRAERPITLYKSELDSALALGTEPVATARPVPRYLGREAADIGIVRPDDFARIEAIDPDVILASKPTHEKLYDRLRRIAPTVVLTEGINWKANFRQDGEALGYADRAESFLTRYDRRAAQVRQLARSRELPGLPAVAERSFCRPFIQSIFGDLGIPHNEPACEPTARPGRDDEWTLGEGYLAAMAVLDDLERRYR